MIRRILILFFVVIFCAGKLSAAEYSIKKGENVSRVVLKLTGSTNYRGEGIQVIKTNGDVITLSQSERRQLRTRFDHVRPGWTVVVPDELAKTVQVKPTVVEGKTLAQVCQLSSDARCTRTLSRLNSISKSQAKQAFTATERIYALPGILPVSVVVSNVSDMCLNIVGVQTSLPKGMMLDVQGRCSAPTEDACLNIEGVQTTVPEGKIADGNSKCLDPPPPDVCSNIGGLQPSIPVGKTVDGKGNCLDPPSPSLFRDGYFYLLIGSLLLLVFGFWGLNQQSKSRAEVARAADIQQEQLRELKVSILEFVSKFETFFRSYLNPKANTVEIFHEYLPWNGRGVIRIVPHKGQYPNLTNHKADLALDLDNFRRRFPSEAFTLEEPFVDDQPGVCVPFVRTGGGL